jgi:hypothetical protein
MRKKFAAVSALIGVLGLTLGMASAAGADDFTASQSTVTVAPSVSTTVAVSLVAVKGEWMGDHGCDLKNPQNDQGHFVTASVTSGDTNVATVSPSSLRFTDCGAPQNIVITSVNCGDTAVSIAYDADRSAGGSNAVFTDTSIAVHVTGCDAGGVTSIGTCAQPAAPAWAAAILQANGVKGSNKGYSTLITSVAHAMVQGAAFPSGTTVVSKTDQAAYSAAVYAYMQAQNQAQNLKLNLAKGPDQAARPGWECQTHSSV